MKTLFKIAVVAVVASLMACRNVAHFPWGDKTLARVGREHLSERDVQKAVPIGLSAMDSISYAESYVEKWVIRQLKLQEAELMFPESAEDIDRMVEEYRQSLLIRKIEQYYLDTEMRTDVSEEDIAEYYSKHKQDFRLSKTVVRGEIVEVGEQYRRREQLLKLMRSTKSEERRDFEELCAKNRFRLTQFTEWTDLSEFASNLPLLRSAQSNEKMLSKRDVQQIHNEHTYYCFRITDVLTVGETMSMDMARENIRRIILNQRQGEVIRAHEEKIVEAAIANRHAEICKTKNEDETK